MRGSPPSASARRRPGIMRATVRRQLRIVMRTATRRTQAAGSVDTPISAHLRQAREYASRIFHAHAKDTEILPDGRYRHGILWKQLEADPWKSGSWRYRMPGKGQIDWASFIRTLKDGGYDGPLSIEHEDPEFEGSEASVKEGLKLGREHLARFV